MDFMESAYRHNRQVGDTHYFTNEYDQKVRFCSYWHQISEIISAEPSSVLEIGVGNRFVSNYLSERGVNITSLDIDKKLFPDILGSVNFLPFIDSSFEVVSCCEVLEHIPYDYFSSSLLELFRITRRYAIISLPDASNYIRLDIKMVYIDIKKLIYLPSRKKSVHQFKGEHYWEVGKYGYSLKRIVRDIQKIGFTIAKTYRVFEHPYHRFFVLEKKINHIPVSYYFV